VLRLLGTRAREILSQLRLERRTGRSARMLYEALQHRLGEVEKRRTPALDARCDALVGGFLNEPWPGNGKRASPL